MYAVWTDSTSIADVLTPGVYVTYNPSSTSYTVPGDDLNSGKGDDQTYNPSLTTSWRVLTNDGTNGAQLITTTSIGNMGLANRRGYNNLVKVLNNLGNAYVNSTYAISGRSV